MSNIYYAIEINGIEGSLAPYESLEDTIKDFKEILKIEPTKIQNNILKLDLIETQSKIRGARIKMYSITAVKDNSGNHVVHDVAEYLNKEEE